MTTDAAMVRDSTAADRPTVAETARQSRKRARAPMIAWGSSAAVVLAIAAGVGARSLGHSHRPAVSASPVLPAVALAREESAAVLAPEQETVPLPAPPPTSTATSLASSTAPYTSPAKHTSPDAPRRGHAATAPR